MASSAVTWEERKGREESGGGEGRGGRREEISGRTVEGEGTERLSFRDGLSQARRSEKCLLTHPFLGLLPSVWNVSKMYLI